MRLPAMLVIATIVALTGPVRAQYTNSYGYSFNNPVSATANSMFWDSMNRRLLYRMMLKKRGYTNDQLGKLTTVQMKAILDGGEASAAPAADAPSPKAAKPVVTKTYPGATRFKPKKQRILVGTIVNSLVKDKAQRKALVELFDGAINAYEAEARKTGFDNDIAGAMAFFIGAAYMVHHDGEAPDETGLEQLAGALREQLATAAVAKIAAADKQRFYEMMLVLGTYLMVGRQQAISDGDTETAGTLKAAAGEALKGFLKLDPTSFRITSNGLELISS